MSKRLYCGPPGLKLRERTGAESKRFLRDYFPKGRTYYTHRCRTALKKACELVQLGAGDEVLVPSYNCGAEVDVFFKSGMSVTPYRVKATTEIDLEDFARRITKRTKAALVTHYFGFPQAVSNVAHVCREKGIYLIEDCAHALFSRDGNGKLGSVGDLAVFSFPKSLGVPDGGALIINNGNLTIKGWSMTPAGRAEIFLGMLPLFKSTLLGIANDFPGGGAIAASFGGVKQAAVRSRGQTSEGRPGIPNDYYYDDELTNRGMSGVTKALLQKIEVDMVVDRRRKNLSILLASISDVDGVRPLFYDLPEGVCPLYLPLLVRDRAKVAEEMARRHVRAISWWKGYHEALPWHEFPEACALKDSVLALPVNQDLSENQIKYIARQVLEVLSKT